MPPSHFTWQDVAGHKVSVALHWPGTAPENDTAQAQTKFRLQKEKSFSYSSKDLTPVGRCSEQNRKARNLGYQSCPDKHESSTALNYTQIQHSKKNLFFLQKAKSSPLIRQRKCHFLSVFSISKECSGTEFVDRNHRGREDGTVCYGLPGFSESARVIKLQCSQAAKRPKERSCI